MTRVGVLGASGFIGSAVADALQRRGAQVVPVEAPRLTSAARDLGALRRELARLGGVVELLVEALGEVDVVVNAAGLPDATAGNGNELYGANALLPGLVAEASGPTGARLVHVSSAAVQGRREVLDESPDTAPFSPYSRSKALGEQLVLGYSGTVVFRPTSVHGASRGVTQTLARVAGSAMASVASPGDDPTPQVLVENVADAIAYVVLTAETPPTIVLQPSDGLTTTGVLEALGRRRPHRIPRPVARILVTLLFLGGRPSGRLVGIARRLEMLWFGQRQQPGWLDSRWKPVKGWNEGIVIR